MHPDSRLAFTAPITERLRQRDTGLRTTADPSLLVQSLIDLSEFNLCFITCQRRTFALMAVRFALDDSRRPSARSRGRVPEQDPEFGTQRVGEAKYEERPAVYVLFP